MSSDLRSFLAFLDEQRSKQASHFPALKVEMVLGFMGTTSLAGSFATCSVHALRGVERGVSTRALRVQLAGPLPRAPRPGECIAVHLTHLERYQGYQVKSRPLGGIAQERDLVEPRGADVCVKGAQLYTVHHSPYTLKFFEAIPFEDVQETLKGVRFALVAMGETANLSPRFVFHHEVKDGRLTLFHGDGLALKTYMNVRANRNETRLVLDLDDFSGWAVRGTVEEFAPHQHPLAHEKICAGFSAGGWGKPSRTFRFVAESFERLRPRT